MLEQLADQVPDWLVDGELKAAVRSLGFEVKTEELKKMV